MAPVDRCGPGNQGKCMLICGGWDNDIGPPTCGKNMFKNQMNCCVRR